MRTTIVLNDGVYERVVSEAVRCFGSARKISAVINMALEEKLGAGTLPKKMTFKEFFGSGRGKLKKSAQEIKDELRDAWG